MGTSTPDPTHSVTPSPEPTPSPTWPLYDRSWLSGTRVDTRWIDILTTKSPEFGLNSAGRSHLVTWQIDEPISVTISSRDGSTDPYHYHTQTDGSYIGNVILLDEHTALVTETPPLEEVSTEVGAATLFRVDLENGTSSLIPPPPGQEWGPWPADVMRGTSGVFALTKHRDRSASCVTSIDPAGASVLGCIPNRTFTMATVDPGGPSVLAFPTGENVGDCRERWHFSASGHSTERVGNPASCTLWDGVRLNGWEVWSEVDPTDSGMLGMAALYADGPDGERLALGYTEAGSTMVCEDSRSTG